MAPLLHVALLRPLIPGNTGTIGRLTMATRGRLHLVGTLGFSTDERACRRAGLDYWHEVDCVRWPDLEALAAALPPGSRTWAFSARASRRHTDVAYAPGDCLLFGDEARGLPDDVVAAAEAEGRALRLPLLAPGVRSLNLANAASIAVYEALRQLGFPGEVAPTGRAASGATPTLAPTPESAACSRA